MATTSTKKKPLPKPAAKKTPPKPAAKAPAKKEADTKVPAFLKNAKPTTTPPAGKVFTQSSTAATKPAPKAEEKKQPDKVVGIGHNGGPTVVSRNVLKSVVDRIENLEEEKQGLADDIKEVYTEAKQKGLDVKTIRTLVSMRRRDKEKLRAEKEMLENYVMILDPELAECLS